MSTLTRETKFSSITFQNGHSCSITSTLGEFLDEINHYGAFFLTNVGTYSTSTTSGNLRYEKARAEIKPQQELTYDIRKWISLRMRG